MDRIHDARAAHFTRRLQALVLGAQEHGRHARLEGAHDRPRRFCSIQAVSSFCNECETELTGTQTGSPSVSMKCRVARPQRSAKLDKALLKNAPNSRGSSDTRTTT